MMQVTAGPDLIRIIRQAYRANMPVMLHGRHGIGKSEVMQESAHELGIGCLVLDLSLMEPPDLIGIPTICDWKTVYACPSLLPTGGKGLMVLEEVNRCPRYMRAPTFQLLTARKLNDCALPKGWLPMAAVTLPARRGRPRYRGVDGMGAQEPCSRANHSVRGLQP